MTLCQHVASASTGSPPFFRLLATGYYDGPTAGFTACKFCQKPYFFRLLTWDDGQDLRIFGLVGLDESFAEIFGRFQTDKSSARSVILLQKLAPELDSELERISKREIEVVIGSHDLLNEVLAIRLGGSNQEQDFDWFTWLGIKK